MNASPQGIAGHDRAMGDYPLLVVVVNYRTPDLTVNCLETLEQQVALLPGTRVVVVDNESGDGSAERIAAGVEGRRWGGWVTLVRSPRNGGFAYGNNRGIEAGFALGRPEFVLLLNSDTLVHGDALPACVRAMRTDPRVGVLSCKVLNRDGTIQNVARRFPTPVRIAATLTGLPWKVPRLFGWADGEDPGWDRDGTGRDVDWLGGAFMMIRAEVIERLGGLDESFFFYGEDVEFCHRAWRAGWRCRYEPVGSVTHLGGASSDPARLPESARSTHAWVGRYLVQRRCYGRLAAGVVRAMDAGAAKLRLRRLRRKGQGNTSRAEQLRGVLAFLGDRANRAAIDAPPATALRLSASEKRSHRDLPAALTSGAAATGSLG